MIYVVQNSTSNFFINDLLEKVSYCLRSLGFSNTITQDEFPSSGSNQYIFIPHEWVNSKKIKRLPERKILARSIGLIVENPGSPWYEECKSYKSNFPKFLFINKSAMEAFPASLKRKSLIQLFNEPSADQLNFEEWSKRKFTYTFIGGADESRRKKIASLSPIIASENSYISLPTTQLSSSPSKGQVSRLEFENILRNSKILINLHRENTQSIEWQRVLAANALGTVVISEPSSENESILLPWLIKEFRSPSSFLNQIESMPKLFAFANQALRVSSDLKDLNSTKELKNFLRPRLNLKFKLFPYALRRPKQFLYLKLKQLQSKVFQRIYSWRWHFPEYTQIFHTFDRITSGQKSLALDNIKLRRIIEGLSLSQSRSESELELIAENMSDQEPKITIAVTIYNEGELLVECLDSILNLKLKEPFDVIVCSDAGDYETLEVAERKLKESSLSFKIVRRLRNGGVGASRNSILRQSRGSFTLILDGDNSLFPYGAQHLLNAIEENEDASFAYGLLAVKRNGLYVDTMNHLPWEKSQFSKVGNFIDALTLINREKILNIGGYTESLNLYGWEDFDLWARIAHFGGFGVQSKNFVATYLRRGNSMISTTNLDGSRALAEIRERSQSIW